MQPARCSQTYPPRRSNRDDDENVPVNNQYAGMTQVVQAMTIVTYPVRRKISLLRASNTKKSVQRTLHTSQMMPKIGSSKTRNATSSLTGRDHGFLDFELRQLRERDLQTLLPLANHPFFSSPWRGCLHAGSGWERPAGRSAAQRSPWGCRESSTRSGCRRCR